MSGMKTLDTLATVTPDGKITVDAPDGIKPGTHRVRLQIEEEVIERVREFYKGRPVYTEDDRANMDCPLPPEPEWEKEWQNWEQKKK